MDLIVKNVEVVSPGHETVDTLDIAIENGKVVGLEPEIQAGGEAEVFDGDGLLAFPGVVDAHQHFGIYNPLSEDIVSESRAALQGGVTTGITYTRTGQYYQNKSGSYADFVPEILELTEGRSHVDYAFHLAPLMQLHIDELENLVSEFGITSFKIFMFYGGHGLHGRSDDQSDFLMTPPGERYDYAHFEFVMRGIRAAMERFPEKAPYISCSLHCESAEIMTAYSRLIEQDGELSGLEAYHQSRPPHSEGLAITVASYLAHETGCKNINLLHLSSAKAVEAALRMAETFPDVNFRREVTIGHLLSDLDTANGSYGKVNPPIRPREDVEALWDAVLDGKIDWVVSDHACCRTEMKVDPESPDDVFLAKAGFGGTEYILSGLISEGRKRGLPYQRIAELTSWNPSQRYGLLSKGTIDIGYDADLVLVAPDESYVVHARDSESTQGYTPFEGHELTGRVRHVFLRGKHVLDEGKVTGAPLGRYIKRPTEPVDQEAR